MPGSRVSLFSTTTPFNKDTAMREFANIFLIYPTTEGFNCIYGEQSSNPEHLDNKRRELKMAVNKLFEHSINPGDGLTMILHKQKPNKTIWTGSPQGTSRQYGNYSYGGTDFIYVPDYSLVLVDLLKILDEKIQHLSETESEKKLSETIEAILIAIFSFSKTRISIEIINDIVLELSRKVNLTLSVGLVECLKKILYDPKFVAVQNEKILRYNCFLYTSLDQLPGIDDRKNTTVYLVKNSGDSNKIVVHYYSFSNGIWKQVNVDKQVFIDNKILIPTQNEDSLDQWRQAEEILKIKQLIHVIKRGNHEQWDDKVFDNMNKEESKQALTQGRANLRQILVDLYSNRLKQYELLTPKEPIDNSSILDDKIYLYQTTKGSKSGFIYMCLDPVTKKVVKGSIDMDSTESIESIESKKVQRIKSIILTKLLDDLLPPLYAQQDSSRSDTRRPQKASRTKRAW